MIIYLVEIKNRFFFVLILLISVLFMSYIYKEILLFLVIKPFSVKDINANLDIFYFIFTDLTEILSVYLKLISFIAVQLTIFNVSYHCFIFFSPALFKKEYNFVSTLVITCFTIWLFSLIIVNYYIIPLSWQFFFSFQSMISTKFISLHFEPKIKEYLNFCLSIYYNVILYSQLFALLFIINLNYNYNNIKLIKKYRKFYYFIFVVFSTCVSPPDILSQLIISFGLIFVYEFSIIIFIIKKLLIRQVIKTN